MFCRKLGFDRGVARATGGVAGADAMPVGACGVGELLTRCSKGTNAWGRLGSSSTAGAKCAKGQSVGVAIHCSGRSFGRPSSCGSPPPAASYRVITSGRCRDNPGYRSIASVPECQTAARYINRLYSKRSEAASDADAVTSSRNYDFYPHGCRARLSYE